MARGHILVVAPGQDMRRSLAFVLAAEGYDVVATDFIDLADPASGSGYDCVVLDHQAVAGAQEDIKAFFARVPVLLVAGAPVDWLADAARGIVEKPVMGDAVAASVLRIVGEDAAPASP